MSSTSSGSSSHRTDSTWGEGGAPVQGVASATRSLSSPQPNLGGDFDVLLQHRQVLVELSVFVGEHLDARRHGLVEGVVVVGRRLPDALKLLLLQLAQHQEAQALLGLVQRVGGPVEGLGVEALLQAETQRLDLHQQVRFVQLADGQPVDPAGKALCGRRRRRRMKIRNAFLFSLHSFKRKARRREQAASVTFDESVVSGGLGSQHGFARAGHAEDGDPARLLLQPVEFLPDAVHELRSADEHHGPLRDAALTEHRLD
ncbi:hypothetical protein EYF80_043586 [Liparis tanakae]|uniref:Uncharacterized protein n=1 Tax=Liparis tanakae TaxID=230148 RepID=A0A4Z2FY73_9TELE|nr:hypothetical protein EYF80_043586 [Liparis tanakae]